MSPTDPAVVFSVLGRREIAGRSGDILEGESGANDPVGIALMVALLAAGGITAGSVPAGGRRFVLQMGVGLAGRGGRRPGAAVVHPAGRRCPARACTRCARWPARSSSTASPRWRTAPGFLAVFVAGILLGDARAPYKREIERFHSALASLGEIVAFVVLGLTVDLDDLARPDVWIPGLILGRRWSPS